MRQSGQEVTTVCSILCVVHVTTAPQRICLHKTFQSILLTSLPYDVGEGKRK